METWKDIEGYEGYYQVSNLGNVKSLTRKEVNSLGALRTYKSKILVAHDDNRGYSILRLYKNGKGSTKRIHRLVAQAFVENPNDLKEINHIDGDKKNNKAKNLEWCTRKENIRHAMELGLFKNHGAYNSLSKLTFEEAEVIRERYSTGDITQAELANEFNIDRSQISLIVNHKAYAEGTNNLKALNSRGN